VSQPSVIHLTCRPGREDAINAIYRQEIGEPFLIWTRSQIAERIRAVNAGQVETLAHLRGKLASIEDWNRAFPEMCEGRGNILIADHEATLTPLQLLNLRKFVLFIERHKEDFDSIEGLETAKMLLGGAGRSGIGVAVPHEPKSEIYKLCVRYKKLELWTQYYKFRNEPSRIAWASLKVQTVPWRADRTVEALVKALPDYSDKSEFPPALLLRRALLPTTNMPPDDQAVPGKSVVQLRKRR
jgi:hypothetical protein